MTETYTGNTLIAQFMGVKSIQQLITGPAVYDPDEKVHNTLDYDRDWNMLISVVEYIEQSYDVYIDIGYAVCGIHGVGEKPPYITVNADSKREAVWTAVVNFINYINDQNKQR